MTARALVSRQVEESQRIAQETRNRERQRERDRLNEKAKDSAVFAEKTARLKAIRMAREASGREEAINAAAAKLTAPRKKTTAKK
jgi:uncharacterized protein YaiL (DUF2058 family)